MSVDVLNLSDQFVDDFHALENQLAALQAANDQLVAARNDEPQVGPEVQIELDALRIELDKVRQELIHATQQLTVNRELVTTLEMRYRDLAEDYQAARTELKEARETRTAVKTESKVDSELLDQLESLRRANQRLQDQVEEFPADWQEHQAKYKTLKGNWQMLKDKQKQSGEEIERLKKENFILRSRK